MTELSHNISIVRQQQQSHNLDSPKEQSIEYHTFDSSDYQLFNIALKSNTCLLWAWSDVPNDIKLLLSQGGDEDHLAFVPINAKEPFVLSSQSFGCCSINEYLVYNDDVGGIRELIGSFFIGSH